MRSDACSAVRGDGRGSPTDLCEQNAKSCSEACLEDGGPQSQFSGFLKQVKQFWWPEFVVFQQCTPSVLFTSVSDALSVQCLISQYNPLRYNESNAIKGQTEANDLHACIACGHMNVRRSVTIPSGD